MISNWYVARFEIFLFACALCAVFAATIRNKAFAAICVGFAFAFAGAVCFQIHQSSVSTDRIRSIYDLGLIASGSPVVVEGKVNSAPEMAYDGYFLMVDTTSVSFNGQKILAAGDVRVFVPTRTADDAAEFKTKNFRAGSIVRVACDLMREEKFQNPGVVSRIELLDGQGIDATCTVKSPSLIEKTEQTDQISLSKWILDRRQNVIENFRQHFEPKTAGIMIASLLGDKYFLDKDTADVFREGGTFHVLVISGLHITFIGGLVLLLLRLFTSRKLLQILGACGFLWAYTFAVGAEVPVVRASVMFTVIAFSQVVRRKGSLLNSLGLCALLLLAWKPDDLFSASFQLTFASVTAIAAMGFPAVEKMRAIGRWLPTAEAPFPARVPIWLKRFCEMLYWRGDIWETEERRQVWSARIFKRPFLNSLNALGFQGAAAYLVEGILISTIVQIWLLPFGVVYFHRITPAGIFLNLWVGVCIAVESVLAVAAFFLGQISNMLALPFVRLVEIFNWMLLSVPRIFTDGIFSSIRLPAYTGQGRAIYALCFVPILLLAVVIFRWDPFAYGKSSENIGFASFIFQKSVTYAAATFLFFSIAIVVLHPLSSSPPDGRLHIDFLDVGQGDSALVTFPDGETLLVDGGGQINFRDSDANNFEPDAPRIGEAVVSQFLWEKGYSKIDYILATHADADHIQGLTDVARNFDIREAFFARTPVNDPEYTELAEVIQKKKIAASRLSRGDLLNIGGVDVQVLFPENDDSPDAISDNDHSLVLRLVYGSRAFLLTGDVERKAENQMLSTPEYLTADVVKVPHHGSHTSSTQQFVDAVKPRVAIISVGRRSRFGHPHNDVVERWKNSGAKVITTGENGTISISTNGSDLVIKSFVFGD
ncbi:MAG TPA: ComEC/Rec2 family competence protein, partial [Pyrinomonadaceae bacterium]|nr:ComEC/Rec2 family competence protein [Pyrinomonadaceae bacterium]